MRTYFHTFVFAAYPVLLVVGANAGVLPLDGASVLRALAGTVLLTAALLGLLRLFVSDPPTRAACLSFALIGFNLFALAGGGSSHPAVAAVYTVAVGAMAVAIVRPWKSRRRRSGPLNAAACVLLAANLYAAAPAVRAQTPWRPLADAIVAGVEKSAVAPPSNPQPDIYHVVLDGFGRPDVLQELYSLDLQPFVSALESRGFIVPDASRSNYSQTFLSLASTLNLTYLDSIAGAMPQSADRRVLDYLIQHNALARLARRAGYRVVAVGSDYAATAHLAAADECRCEQYGLSELEVAAINLTPLRALPLDRWTSDAHRRKVEQSFLHVERAAGEEGPKLVFAHVVAPHPPFVFEADGRPRRNGRGVFGFHDGDQFFGAPEEYVEGYRAQAAFVAVRVLELVDAIVRQSGPSAVILLHGDHGPRSTWNWNDLLAANARERIAIFSAYRFPGPNPPALPRDVSPVNALRALASRHLGADLPPLPDTSFVSTWERPFEFTRVEPNARGEHMQRAAAAAAAFK